MRRTNLLASAVLVTLAAVLVLLAPSFVVGAPTTSHGGTPSDVFMKTQSAPEACGEDINPDGRTVFPLEIEVAATSHVLAYFTFEWTGLTRGEVAGLNLLLDGTNGSEQYDFAKTRRPNPNGTVMSTFPTVAPGSHTVAVYGVVNQTGSAGDPDLRAGLENCALTAFVIPVA